MKKSFAVLGLGKFGMSLARELSRAGAEVLAVDIDKEMVHEVADEVTCAMCADVRDAETLETLGLSNMDAVIVAITGDLNASVMATICSKEAGVPYVMAKAEDDIHTKILKKVGEECTEVIIGAKNSREETVYEIADLAYHVMVLMVEMGISLNEIRGELASRHVVDHKVKQETMK